MSIGFRKTTPQEIRAKLEKMTEAELIEHGKLMREFTQPSPRRGVAVQRLNKPDSSIDAVKGSTGGCFWCW
jgi:hypothetical protein